jgi:hypothetical protein
MKLAGVLILTGIVMAPSAPVHRVGAQRFSGAPLDSLANVFPALPAATSCSAMPDSLLQADVRRGLTLCGPVPDQVPRYVLLRDSAGAVHWFNYTGRAIPSARARADAEQLASKLAIPFGAPVRCSAERWIWTWSGGHAEVKLEYETDAIKVDDPAYGDGRRVVLNAEWQLSLSAGKSYIAPCRA